MNSIVQCLRSVSELQSALIQISAFWKKQIFEPFLSCVDSRIMWSIWQAQQECQTRGVPMQISFGSISKTKLNAKIIDCFVCHRLLLGVHLCICFFFFFPSSSLLDRLIKFLKLCTVWYLVEVPRVWNRLLLHYSLPSFHCASEDFYDNHMAMPNQ